MTSVKKRLKIRFSIREIALNLSRNSFNNQAFLQKRNFFTMLVVDIRQHF